MRGRNLTVVLTFALVLVIGIGGGAAFLVGRSQAAGAATSGTAEPGTPGPQSSGAQSRSSSSSPTSSSPGSSQSPQPAGPTEDVSVQLTAQALKSTDAEPVRLLLQRYFNSINTGDYDGWVASVTTSQSGTRPREEWLKSYSTTRDSDIVVLQIQGNDPMTVRLRFVSQQAVALAPSDLPVACIKWDVSYQLFEQAGALVVGNSIPAALTKVAC